MIPLFSGRGTGVEASPENGGRGSDGPPWWVVRLLLLVGAFLIVGYGVVETEGILLLVELLVATTALVGGGFLGFLFGIPRGPSGSARNGSADGKDGKTESRDSDKSPATFAPSTNLEQIADWLTKMIVGVGLVELKELIGWFGRFGDGMAKVVPGQAVSVASQLVLIAFGVLGFIASYLWTRIYYGYIQTGADMSVWRLLAARFEATEKAAFAADRLSVMLAQGEVKPGTSSGAANAMLRANLGGADPASALPQDLQERLKRLREWDQFDYDSDPCADLFPGVGSAEKGRELTAEIVTHLPKALLIKLRVRRTEGPVLQGPVMFLLHPTFKDRVEVVQASDDVAELKIISEGSFTVVAILDGGQTVLSYNLVTLPAAPKWFRDQ